MLKTAKWDGRMVGEETVQASEKTQSCGTAGEPKTE